MILSYIFLIFSSLALIYQELAYTKEIPAPVFSFRKIGRVYSGVIRELGFLVGCTCLFYLVMVTILSLGCGSPLYLEDARFMCVGMFLFLGASVL